MSPSSAVIEHSTSHVIVECERGTTGVLRAPLVHERATRINGVENDNGRAEEARVDDITWLPVSAYSARAEAIMDSPYFLPHSPNVMC